jgi:DNA-directed RNA polymerase I subunit RPA1
MDISKFNEQQTEIVSHKAVDDEHDILEVDATISRKISKQKQISAYDEEDKKDVEVVEEKVYDDTAVDENGQEINISTSNVHSCTFSTEGNVCEIEFRFPSDQKKILMIDIVERAAPLTTIREIPGITKAFLHNSSLITEGSNIKGLWQFDDMDHTSLESNDIAAILRTFGVEAARQAIIKEISAVFAVYGIEVDRRHLTLIADFMTFEGGYKPFNRAGMESNVSPFAKMSFETTFHFLTDAAIKGDYDTLNNPSAKLVMGKLVQCGTGSFDLMADLAVK